MGFAGGVSLGKRPALLLASAFSRWGVLGALRARGLVDHYQILPFGSGCTANWKMMVWGATWEVWINYGIVE